MSSGSWTPELLHRAAQETGAAIDLSALARQSASGDWGRLARGAAVGVANPSDASQLAKLVGFAYQHELPIAVRSGGMSQSGQSIPRNGLSVSVRGLRRVSQVEYGTSGSRVIVEPGATWRDLLTAVGPDHMPQVVPLNLDLTIGGTLSAGGIGSTSHRHGPAVQHVQSLDVVSGTGSMVRCGPSESRDVFVCVLGGFGQFGVISRAEILLRQPRPRIRTYFLLYDRLDSFLGDQRLLAESNRFDHMEGFASAGVQGLRKGPNGKRVPFAQWFYGLHVSIEHEPKDSLEANALLSGLHFWKLVHTEDDTQETFAARYDARFETMRMLGSWEQQHPWFECLIPWEAAEQVVPRALALLPMFLGDGHRISCVSNAEDFPSLAMPTAGPTLAFAVLPMGVHPLLCDRALEALEGVNEVLLGCGGKRYVSGWLFEPNAERWRAHYGRMYATVAQIKSRMDPRGIFSSCLDFRPVA